MKINIIHLNNRGDRLELLKKELLTQSIMDYELWEGITSESTPRANIAKAHKQIVQDAKERGLEEVCIAEDDFHFPSPDGFDYFIKNKPKEFDIYLSGVYRGLYPLNIIYENTVSIKRFTGLHFYIVHKNFYDTFLNLDTTINSIDNAIGHMAYREDIKIKCVFPFAAIQHETKSDNSNCIFQHKHFFNKTNTYGLF